ncbi:MAG: hypothetical protein QXW51_00085 [Sulfolobaceae archaeon]
MASIDERIKNEEDFKEGINKLAEIVIYLNNSGILDSVLDFLKSQNFKDIIKSPTFKAIIELLGNIKELIDSGSVNTEDFINGVMVIARHIDKIARIINMLDQHGVLDVVTSGLTKAAEIIIKEKKEGNVVELLAAFDDPDVKLTLAYIRILLKELGKSVEPLISSQHK